MEQSISATLYPKKIIIATMINQSGGSTWITTDCISILPIDVLDEELGVTAVRHILLSEIRDVSSDEIWDFRSRYKALAKFKTEGQLMKHSKLAKVILSDNNLLRFEPRNNKYSLGRNRYYQGMPTDNFHIKYPCSFENIGIALRKVWELSIIT
jgi:hypothetical protein